MLSFSTKYPQVFPRHQSPMSPDTHTVAYLPPIPPNFDPGEATSNARQHPLAPDVPSLRTQAPQLPISAVQPSLHTHSRSSVHEGPVPVVTQPQALPSPLPPQRPINQTSPISPTPPYSRAPLVPREGVPSPKLVPRLPSVDPTAAPTALAEVGLEGQSQRDDRWLLVALLVPTCVFLVVLLALGIVYCTRCAPHAPNKRITDCYRWVTHAGNKSPTEPMPPRGSLTGVQTCRTSV